MPPLDPMPCACCARVLVGHFAEHGVLWICRSCRAGATTLAVLRSAAPRRFVNALWQTARDAGVPCWRTCPSCTRPLLDVGASDAGARFQVCCRCYLVWMEGSALVSLRLPPAAVPDELEEHEARRVALTVADLLLDALG